MDTGGQLGSLICRFRGVDCTVDRLYSMFPRLRDFDRRVDVVRLARDAGVQIRFETNSVELGRFVQEPGKSPQIFVSRQQRPSDQRAIIAHELGHWVVSNLIGRSSTRQSLTTGSESIDIDMEEGVADVISDEILMPPGIWSREVFSKSAPSHDDMARMLTQWDVPLANFMRKWSRSMSQACASITLLPSKFSDVSSDYIIDGGIAVTRGGHIAVGRTAIRPFRRISYSSIAGSASIDLELVVDGEKRTISGSVCRRIGCLNQASVFGVLTN